MILDSGPRFADSPLIRAGPCSAASIGVDSTELLVCLQPGKRFPTAWGWLILLYLTPLWTFSESEAPSSPAWSGVGALKPVLQRCCGRGSLECTTRNPRIRACKWRIDDDADYADHDARRDTAHDETCARQLVAVWTAHAAGRTVERRMLDNNRSALSYASSRESGNLD
jgi:hypothetical protein